MRGGQVSSVIDHLQPAVWLGIFATAATLRSIANRVSYVREERGTHGLIIVLQTRLYRALANAHWDTVRRLAPPRITSALQTQTYEACGGFTGLVQLVAAILLVVGYLTSVATVFPLAFPFLLITLGLMWWLNVRHSDDVLTHSEEYVEATTELHERYEDWAAISRISSLGADGGKLADRFESGARDAAASAVAYSRAAAATRLSYDVALILGIVVGVPVAWWLETPPAILAFGMLAFVRIIPRAGTIQTGYQGLVNAVAPLQAIERLTDELEQDAIAESGAEPLPAWESLSLDDVGIEDTVRDGDRHWILSGICLELKRGEWLALTGPTGAGKTTLAEVMLALVRPQSRRDSH